MNYDMVGSPNYIFMVYDADQSSFAPPAGVPIPAGSTAIEDLYESYYTSIGEPYDDTQFSGRSDYEAFIVDGIPSGGLFTGAEGIKTSRAAVDLGRHRGCSSSTRATTSRATRSRTTTTHALEVNSDLIAYAQLTFAFSTESVNGVAGRPCQARRRARCRHRPAQRGRSSRRAEQPRVGPRARPWLSSLANGRQFPYVRR